MSPTNLPPAGIAYKLLRACRIRYRHWMFAGNWRREYARRLRQGADAGIPCPVCGGSSRTTRFDRPEGTIEKYICSNCGHLFSDFLQTDPGLGQEMFHFDTENPGRQTQVELLEELIWRSGSQHGVYLDFGVGGNLAAFQEVQARYRDHRLMACDTYPSPVPGYFQTYAEDSPQHCFDGISSYAVVEHLTDTLATWTYFNRLLKPVVDGGGIMVHAFPSQLHHEYAHWSIQIRSHVCLFSHASLARVCEQTGFRMEEGTRYRPTGLHAHGIMVFRKIRDL